MMPFDNSPSTRWRAVGKRIIKKFHHKCLDIEAANEKNGARLISHRCLNGGAISQSWHLEYV